MINNVSNSRILEDVNKQVYGHIDVKKKLINVIAASQMRHYQKWLLNTPDSELVPLQNMLLIGASGTGKTHLITTLLDMLNIPVYHIDATHITSTGCTDGYKLTSLPDKLMEYANLYYHRNSLRFPSPEGNYDKMIVVIDEIDKLSGHKGDHNERWYKQAQSSLLKAIENIKVTFIFAGAFTELFNDKVDYKQQIGFYRQGSSCNIKQHKNITEKDIVNYGMLPELIGRIACISQLDTLNLQDYKHIFNNILWPAKLKELMAYGLLETCPSEELIINICETAMKSGQGIRALKRELNNLYFDKLFHYEENQPCQPDTQLSDEIMIMENQIII